MSHDWDRFSHIFHAIPLAPETDCSYFPDRLSQARAFRLNEDVSEAFMEAALSRGYRRCGDVFYQQDCAACSQCINYRVPVAKFSPSRSQRRIRKRSERIVSSLGRPHSTDEKAEIYLRYQRQQHHGRPAPGAPEKPFDPQNALTTMQFQMYQNPRLTREIELRLDGTLIGFGTLDVAIATASAVYFVFDPDYAHFSLGTLAILREIEWCLSEGLAWLQLGYYIPGHPKMDYKQNFRPGQILHRASGEWQCFDS